MTTNWKQDFLKVVFDEDRDNEKRLGDDWIDRLYKAVQDWAIDKKDEARRK